MEGSQLVDSYKFKDVVQLWARERLVHELLVGRELAKGVIAEGLQLRTDSVYRVDACFIRLKEGKKRC